MPSKDRIILILIIVLGLVGIVHAQDNEILDMLPIFESNDSINDTFDAEINTHLYAFYASAGDSVTIGMTQDSDDLDPFLVLLDISGAVLAMDDDSGSVFLAAEITDFEIPADNTYLILATSLSFLEGTDSASDELRYTVSVTGNVAPSDIDTNEVTLEAIGLDYGLVVEGESADTTPATFFVFEGTQGDIVNVLVESDEFPTIIHVFSPAGDRLAVDPSAITSLELPDDGLYLILATDVFFYEAMQEDSYFLGGAFTLSLNNS
ncbi:MAG: PPC domain-containing protein [Anaerolineae bacterium]|nr:PPC domain-containing protein [Anaerolineae bacterium]